MKTRTLLVLAVWVLLLSACDRPGITPPKREPGQSDSIIPLKEGVSRACYPDGSLMTEITFKDYKYHGPARTLYRNGTTKATFTYRDGKKHGHETVYYENGHLYMETDYTDGNIRGIRKMYWETGQLLAEVPYRNNEAQPGLVEYNRSGKKITQYPELLIALEDYSEHEGRIDVRMRLSNHARRVTYWVWNPIPQKWTEVPGFNGEAVYPAAAAHARNGLTVKVKAIYKTRYLNPYVILKEVKVKSHRVP